MDWSENNKASPVLKDDEGDAVEKLLLAQLESLRCQNEKLKHENAYLLSTENLLETKCASLDSHMEEAQTELYEYRQTIQNLLNDKNQREAEEEERVRSLGK